MSTKRVPMRTPLVFLGGVLCFACFVTVFGGGGSARRLKVQRRRWRSKTRKRDQKKPQELGEAAGGGAR